MSKEIRMAGLKEFRAYSNEENDEMYLEGYAAVFEQPTTLFEIDGIEYKEVISRHAFDGTDFTKCCLKYNHESGVPVLSRYRGGYLDIGVDDYGLWFKGKLFKTQTSRDIYSIVNEGGIDECSFAFTLPSDGSGEEYDRETRTRRITKVETLWDVAVVDNPAYGGTIVAARDFFEAEAEKENLERLEREAEEREAQMKRIEILSLM